MDNLEKITMEEKELKDKKKECEEIKEFSIVDKNSKFQILAFIEGFNLAKTIERLNA